MINPGKPVAAAAEIQPMLPVVAEVVAAKRLHGHRVAPQSIAGVAGCRRGFRRHGGAHQHAVAPVARFHDKRRQPCAPPAEDQRGNGHARLVLGHGGIAGVAPRRNGEARVGMGGLFAAFDRLPFPVQRRDAELAAFPPRLHIAGQTYIGENCVPLEHLEGIVVGFAVGAGHDAEIAGFRVDGAHSPVAVEVQPGDIVANRAHLPARKCIGRNQHCQVGLAAGGWEGGRQVMLLARRVFDLDNEHVLRQPAFLARLPACDTQGMAFLAQQRIAAVAGTVASDAQFFREMHDVAPLGIEFADRVHPLYEFALAFDPTKRLCAHACHQVHVHRNVGAVRHLDAAARKRRVDRPHAIGNHVHHAVPHAALEQPVQQPMRIVRGHPVIVGPRVLAIRRANEG